MEFSELSENIRMLYDAYKGSTTRRPALEALEQFWAAEVIRAETVGGKLVGVFYGDGRVIEGIASKRAKAPKILTISINESGDFEDVECLTLLCESIKGSCSYP